MNKSLPFIISQILFFFLNIESKPLKKFCHQPYPTLIRKKRNFNTTYSNTINNNGSLIYLIGSSNNLGKEMLNLTNNFRIKNKLPKLIWNQNLADIAKDHCMNMALGKMPFSHKDFDKRIKKFPRFYRGAGENLAYLLGYKYDTLAKISVNGWINSPGHKKNLLGKYTHCGIAGYRNAKGQWYFSQLFARY